MLFIGTPLFPIPTCSPIQRLSKPSLWVLCRLCCSPKSLTIGWSNLHPLLPPWKSGLGLKVPTLSSQVGPSGDRRQPFNHVVSPPGNKSQPLDGIQKSPSLVTGHPCHLYGSEMFLRNWRKAKCICEIDFRPNIYFLQIIILHILE